MNRGTALLAFAAIAGTIGLSTAAQALNKKSVCMTQACIDQRAAEKKAAEQAATKAAHDKKKAALKAAAERRAADLKRKMDAEIAAEKALIAKRASEPKTIQQTCQMVAGKLVCK